jgi:putative acetyltransferase
MTEAAREVIRYGFDNLHLDLISAYCYPFNARSKGVLQRCGFSYEGILKMAEKRYDGNIYDNECYALTSKEFANQVPGGTGISAQNTDTSDKQHDTI